ncbi:hypothetical protein [Mesorhizobium sp.]|nr:hypothetical protein [Mesorhizobium sp.]
MTPVNVPYYAESKGLNANAIAFPVVSIPLLEVEPDFQISGRQKASG